MEPFAGFAFHLAHDVSAGIPHDQQYRRIFLAILALERLPGWIRRVATLVARLDFGLAACLACRCERILEPVRKDRAEGRILGGVFPRVDPMVPQLVVDVGRPHGEKGGFATQEFRSDRPQRRVVVQNPPAPAEGGGQTGRWLHTR